jgi:hypothetical protein
MIWKEVLMKPVRLEIVTRVLTTFDHCSHCEIIFDQAEINRKFHQRDLNEYPPDLAEEFVRLSDWIKELSRLYRHRLLIRLIDVQSPLGIYKALRHRIRTYPAFIINGKEKYTGWDRERLEQLLDQNIRTDLSRGRKVQHSLT